MATATPAVIAVLERSEGMIAFLCAALEDSGFRPLVCPSSGAGHQDASVVTVLTRYDPQALVWDLGYPYAESWACFVRLRERGLLTGRGVVLTSARPDLIGQWFGADTDVELLGKPYDLDPLLDAVHRVLAQHARAR